MQTMYESYMYLYATLFHLYFIWFFHDVGLVSYDVRICDTLPKWAFGSTKPLTMLIGDESIFFFQPCIFCLHVARTTLPRMSLSSRCVRQGKRVLHCTLLGREACSIANMKQQATTKSRETNQASPGTFGLATPPHLTKAQCIEPYCGPPGCTYAFDYICIHFTLVHPLGQAGSKSSRDRVLATVAKDVAHWGRPIVGFSSYLSFRVLLLWF